MGEFKFVFQLLTNVCLGWVIVQVVSQWRSKHFRLASICRNLGTLRSFAQHYESYELPSSE